MPNIKAHTRKGKKVKSHKRTYGKGEKRNTTPTNPNNSFNKTVKKSLAKRR